ncbi:MAG TPA: carboxylesterase family protein [Candidatus Sulfopaludibacter sp.]|jgi:para-nitrobenzyl esterase|nr:carboxylesterase family protein [Candidatus Sulfopaludibacter sp.]
MNRIFYSGVIGMALILGASTAVGAGPDRVKTANGEVEGAGAESNGVRAFKGVPFAAPPVGELRFAAPAPVKNWTGVKETKIFGPRCMQLPLFGDMNFRSNGMGEDCLYLNVWTPAKTGKEKLPVLVYFFGGGFQAGDGSEPRYDGESMATKGIVAITVNYRLGIFGFFAHPEITKASPHHASGNWALLDQNAALRWVRENIAAFGGDPAKVTIAGESAGSIAVSAQMASPLSRNLIAGAIGESGSIMGALSAGPLPAAEEQGTKFVTAAGVADLAALRAMPADELLAASGKQGMPRFSPVVDGYFLPEAPAAIFAAGKQANVPLLAGWNSEEQGARSVLGREAPTKENFEKAINRLYGANAPKVLEAWDPASDGDVTAVATELASARFIALSTWKWLDLAAATGHKPVYRYYYSRPRPHMRPEMGNATAGLAGGVIKGTGRGTPPPPPAGAVHSAEIEYAMGNLAGNKVYDWTPDDYKVSEVMQAYFANFVKTGNPNGGNLPKWPAVKPNQPAAYLHIDVETKAETEAHRNRYTVLDNLK